MASRNRNVIYVSGSLSKFLTRSTQLFPEHVRVVVYFVDIFLFQKILLRQKPKRKLLKCQMYAVTFTLRNVKSQS